MPPGGLCISIDLELAWGIWDRPDERFFANCAALEPRIVHGLLERFACHEIPATWAIVARLLDRDDTACASTRHGERIWYAPDLIDAIRQSPVAHEIGSHGYAHRYFSQLSGEEARDELAAARAIHERAGLPFFSFVFPRNDLGHLSVVAESGLRVFRGLDRGWFMSVRRYGRVVGRLAHLVDKALPIAPVSVESHRHPNGLVELPGSLLLLGRAGLRRGIPPRLMLAKARRGIDAAISTGRVFHLWFHPSNFYQDADVQLDILDAILNYAARARATGKLDVTTMSSHA